MLETLSILIGVLGVLIAIYQSRRAAVSNNQLNQYLTKLADELVQNISRTIQSQANLDQIDSTSSETREHPFNDNDFNFSRYIDINNDGKKELVVQFPSHARATTLQVYGMFESEFKLVAELIADVPNIFEFEDIDNDKRIEVRAIETNLSSGLPYVMGLRDVVWYRLEGNDFKEIKREAPSLEKIQERIDLFNS